VNLELGKIDVKLVKVEITSQKDIKFLVDSFYDKVNQDDLLSPIFNSFAKVDWESHLPIMYRFWGSILLAEGSYNGAPFPKHLPLPIKDEHFERWVQLFESTVDENFVGVNAEEAKKRATTIAGIFKAKIKMLKG